MLFFVFLETLVPDIFLFAIDAFDIDFEFERAALVFHIWVVVSLVTVVNECSIFCSKFTFSTSSFLPSYS